MPPQHPSSRRLLLRPLRPPQCPSPRLFTHNRLAPRSVRPQMPFLASPSRRPVARFLSTETRRWIREELYLAGKWSMALYAGSLALAAVAFGVQQEYLNHRFPSPAEWGWFTRWTWRSARWKEGCDGKDGPKLVDWVETGNSYKWMLVRLEDPAMEGARLRPADEAGMGREAAARTGYDITAKSEEWRRGYYECLMGAARAAEHLDEYVRDKTRALVFPANTAMGPSNPRPRPVPPHTASAPREEDCEPAFEKPDVFYERLLTTQGFTDRQRIDAAVAYAVWLDYKKLPGRAREMYQRAVDVANASAPSSRPAIHPATGLVDLESGRPSANTLAVATALGVHHAVNANLALALPIFLAVLRARRALADVPAAPEARPAPDDAAAGASRLHAVWCALRSAVAPPRFPPPPDDGTSSPLRTPGERCEEAGLMAYIGEILFASRLSTRSREDGLAWTREAVDLAEEQLRGPAVDRAGQAKCRECLEVGLGNWMAMVSLMAREEEQERDAKRKGAGRRTGWLGFGAGRDAGPDGRGRWESEECLVRERMKRARGLLEDI